MTGDVRKVFLREQILVSTLAQQIVIPYAKKVAAIQPEGGGRGISVGLPPGPPEDGFGDTHDASAPQGYASRLLICCVGS